MRSIASVTRWAAYLLVATTLLVVIVACPEGPSGEPGQPGQPGLPGQPGQPGQPAGIPPINSGSIAAVAATAGETVTIDAATYFTEPQGEALVYAASSSATDVATASAEGSVVSITGVAAGTATISVTATDPGGLSSTQTFVVTVTAADSVPTVEPIMTPCGAEPMLKKKETCEEAVTSTQALESGDTNIVSVALKSGTVSTWVVTAKNKGSTTLRVVDKATKGVARIKQIEVVNTAPTRSRQGP